jgi:hypothetical protein
MPRQLIYTSVPRGLTPGQSGYCTVARSRDLREALIPQLEKFSYYTPEPNYNPIICAHRILDLRGAKFHILSRIVDAGLDFTKRRSFLAHHLIFDPAEIESAATPAEIFSNWPGWLHDWNGHPAWLDESRSLPQLSRSEIRLAKADVWVSGENKERENFLHILAARGADWDLTFTNCFQPGDDSDDFALKAAWPQTPGYEAAKRLGAVFVRFDDLQTSRVPQPRPSPPSLPPEEKPTLPESPSPQLRPSRKLVATAAVLAAVIAFIVTASLRVRTPSIPTPAAPETNPGPPSSSLARSSLNLDLLFPNRATWIALPNQPTSIAPVEELFRRLRANEIFTKNLTVTIQTNLLSKPIPAALFSTPTANLLRLSASNVPPVEITSANGVIFHSAVSNSCAVEISNHFRILVFNNPVELSSDLLQIDANVELRAEFAERLQRLNLPVGAQLALRPLIHEKNGWIDPLAAAEQEFAIVPSTILDLQAAEAHAREIIAKKESSLRSYEDERAALAESQRAILTEPTLEQKKSENRLHALDLAIPKAKAELGDLRTKAAAIPKSAASIDRFALFLCLSNVNTEIFRFLDTP